VPTEFNTFPFTFPVRTASTELLPFVKIVTLSEFLIEPRNGAVTKLNSTLFDVPTAWPIEICPEDRVIPVPALKAAL